MNKDEENAFWKGYDIIKSCTNFNQCDVARNYINNYVLLFGTTKQWHYLYDLLEEREIEINTPIGETLTFDD